MVGRRLIAAGSIDEGHEVAGATVCCWWFDGGVRKQGRGSMRRVEMMVMLDNSVVV